LPRRREAEIAPVSLRGSFVVDILIVVAVLFWGRRRE
jgi:hypothetical protein